jgi:hypothetical protein
MEMSTDYKSGLKRAKLYVIGAWLSSIFQNEGLLFAGLSGV